MNLTHILKGKNPKAQRKLNQLSQKLGATPNILWYPNAGYDFRDVIERHVSSSKPDLYFHTDYNASTDYCQFEKGIVYKDNSRTIKITNVQELEFINPEHNNLNHEFSASPEHACKDIKVFLLKVKTYEDFNSQTSKVIYFCMENVNFMEQVLLNYKISISNLVKVNEVLGDSGGQKTIRLFSSFFSKLKIHYHYLDHEGEQEYKYTEKNYKMSNQKLKHFRLVNIGEKSDVTNWKRLMVKMKKKKKTDDALTRKSLEGALDMMAER